MFESIRGKKILITGSESRLAFRLKEQAEKHSLSILGIDRALQTGQDFSIDLTDHEKLCSFVEKEKPEIIIHTAALTDVDRCEREKPLAWNVNVVGSKNAAFASNLVHAQFINISTDYIFNGENGPYAEDAGPAPINYYGLTKLKAENEVHSICKNALTVRTCVPYDWNERGAPNFLMWVVRELKNGNKIPVVTDQWNTPTYTPHLAFCILKLCEKEVQGVVHVSGKDFLSRFDFAKKIARQFQLDGGLIEPIETKSLSQNASRPMKAGLKVHKVEPIVGVPMLSCEEGLRYCHERQGYHSAP